MDSIDIKILERLNKNSRENASTIGENVNLSVSAVIERIKKLEVQGIITHYSIVVDHQKLGKDVTAYISLSVDHPKYNATIENFAMINPHIVECAYIAGDFDYLIKVITDNTKTLEHIIFELKSITGIIKTKTMIALSTVKHDYSVDIKKI